MRRILGIALPAMLLVSLMAPSTALATGGSVTVGDVTLTKRVLVTVPLTIVCDPIPGADQPKLSGMPGSTVTIRQAVGKNVVTASADLYDDVVCDGSTENLLVVHLWAADTPFKGGQAVLEARIRITDPYVWPEPEGFVFDLLQVVKLRHG